MRFYDKAKILVQSGKGGDGVVSARRETGIPYGGPAGGNGGKGGSVIFKANPHLNTLIDFHNKKKFVASVGEPGRTKEQYGKNAEDLIIHLPVGSIVRDAETGYPIWHCYQSDGEFMICRGGQGGIGNMHFKNSINQYPQFALLGEPGENRDVEIELQLLADVALIGTPSVGKSSLINTIANAKAKVADYPFTTLIPNLGSVKHHGKSFNVVDVPGLIAGASSGKGLGNEFLRHIMKSQILCFMLDMSRYEAGMDDFSVLFDELKSYLENTLATTKDYGDIENVHIEVQIEKRKWQLIVKAQDAEGEKDIVKKDILIVCNKSDVLMDEDIIAEYVKALFAKIQTYLKNTFGVAMKREDFAPYVLSTYTKEGVDTWLDDIARQYIVEENVVFDDAGLDEQPAEIVARNTRSDAVEIIETTEQDMPFLLENEYVDEQDVTYAKVRFIKDREVSRLTYMLPWGNDEAEMRFWNVLDKKRVLQKLLTAGLVKGDIIHVQSFYRGIDDRFVRY